LTYGGGPTSRVSSFTPTLHRTIGTFTKLSSATLVEVVWHGHVETLTGFCQFQLRVDGLPPNGADPDGYGNVSYLVGADHPVTQFGIWSGLPAGSHVVSIYLRGSGGTCSDNEGNFQLNAYVKEQ
jgi:hypothetical protein